MPASERTPRRLLSPVLRLVDRRIEHRVRRTMSDRDQEVAELRAAVADLSRRLRELSEPEKAAARAEVTVAALYGPEGRGERRVNPGSLRRVGKQVAEAAGVPDARREAFFAYRTLLEVENRGVGRIAGGTPNIVGKLTAVPLLKPANDEVLEIGTLYGLFSGALVRQLLRAGVDARLTIVDPVNPVQLQLGEETRGERSGTPINEAVVRANLRYAGVPEDRYRIRRGFSQDPEVRAAVEDRRYGVVIVDGDHGREGVAADLEWVETIAAPGAVVVMDDYGDPKWPGVQEATDAHLRRPGTRLRWVGRVSSSAFLRAG